jgi:hypothetical protein
MNVFAYDLEARQLISLEDRIGARPNPSYPRVSDGRVLWTDRDDSRVYVMDLTDSSALPLLLGINSDDPRRLALDGPWVAYIGWREEGWHAAYPAAYVRTLPVDEGQGTQFPDVPWNHRYVIAIESLAQADIINGFDDHTIKPDSVVSRQQFAKMIVLSLELPVSEAQRALLGCGQRRHSSYTRTTTFVLPPREASQGDRSEQLLTVQGYHTCSGDQHDRASGRE